MGGPALSRAGTGQAVMLAQGVATYDLVKGTVELGEVNGTVNHVFIN